MLLYWDVTDSSSFFTAVCSQCYMSAVLSLFCQMDERIVVVMVDWHSASSLPSQVAFPV